jgi:hypothetical protein
MISHDEKQFLDLLQVYKSEDTKKARRNLSTLGFVVIAAWLLGVRLTDVKVFGADLSHTSESFVLVLGLVLVVYWSAMFYLSLSYDSEIQKERSIQLNNAISAFTERLANHQKYIEEEKKNNPTNSVYVPPDYSAVKSAVEAYERQKTRTAKAAKYGGIIKAAELYVPVVLALWSAVILIVGIAKVL